MRDFLAIAKALSDENRTRALMLLGGGELCLCQIIEMLALAPSTVSKHMRILHQAGLVDSRKAGRWIFFRLPDEDAPAEVHDALAWVRGSLRNDPQVRQDAKRLKTVRRMDMDELCRHYRS